MLKDFARMTGWIADGFMLAVPALAALTAFIVKVHDVIPMGVWQ